MQLCRTVPFLVARLTHVPPELRARLRDAAVRAKVTSARNVASELAQHSAEAAQLVHAMLGAYRYDAIIAAIDSAGAYVGAR